MMTPQDVRLAVEAERLMRSHGVLITAEDERKLADRWTMWAAEVRAAHQDP